MKQSLTKAWAACRMAISVQSYLKIDRVDQAEKQLKVLHFFLSPIKSAFGEHSLRFVHRQTSDVDLAESTPRWYELLTQAMSALDDDATLTQLATAWVDLFLVRHLTDRCHQRAA